MRRIAIILTLLAAALLCQASIAQADGLSLFRNLRDAGLNIDALLAEAPTLEELGIGTAEYARGYSYDSEVVDEVFAYYHPQDGSIESLRVRNLVLDSGCMFDDLYYSFESERFSGYIEAYGPLSASYNAEGWLFDYVYNPNDELRVEFNGDNNLKGLWSTGREYTAQEAQAFALELVGDPFDVSSVDSLAPDIRVYATLQDAGVDVDFYRNAVPKPGPLSITQGYVILEDQGYADVWVSYTADGMQGGVNRGTVWTIGFADSVPWDGPGIRIMASILDEQGNKISTTWDVDSDAITEIKVTYAQDDPEGYRSITLDFERDQATLTAPECRAVYRMSGALDTYYYKALDGADPIYSASGLQMHNTIDSSKLSLYPPLEIIRSTPSGSMAPDGKVHATLAATGVDPSLLLVLVPQDMGLTMQDGILTLPNRGYDEVFVYDDAIEEEFFGSLSDGVWTIDCTAGSAQESDMELIIFFTDDQDNAVWVVWSELSTLFSMSIDYFGQKQFDNCTRLDIVFSDGNRLVTVEDESGISATYDQDGQLTEYYYSALDNTYVSYAADGTLLDISRMTFDASGNVDFVKVEDATPYPPLEIIAE